MVALAGGRRGLLPDVVGRVRRLIDAGVPKTRIAAEEGIHRATVHKIAAGTHPEQSRGRPPRCPTCGARVVFPCRKCAALGIEPPTHDLPPRLQLPPRKELTMSQLADALRKKAAEIEKEAATRAAALRAQADREEADAAQKAAQINETAGILADEPEPAKKQPATKPATGGR